WGNGGSSTKQATVTVNPPTAHIQFSAATYTAAENNVVATITVTRTISTTGSSTVQFATQDGTALAGTNYVGVSGTLTFNDGDASETFQVPLINDGLADGDKSLQLLLSSPVNATLGTPNQATLTLTDAGAAIIPPAPPTSPVLNELVPFSSPVNFSSVFTMR